MTRTLIASVQSRRTSTRSRPSARSSDSREMHVLVELSYTTCAVVKALFWSLVRTVVRAPRKDVRGEVVLVTGAGSGLGRLMSVAFAERGAVVVGWDVNDSANGHTADIVRAAGGRMHVYTCDVRYVTIYVGRFYNFTLYQQNICGMQERTTCSATVFRLIDSRFAAQLVTWWTGQFLIKHGLVIIQYIANTPYVGVITDMYQNSLGR